jgi:type III secretion protein U
MSEGGSEAKKHAASETKLRKQREQGSVASSQEAAGFLACAFGITLVAAMAGVIWTRLQAVITGSLDVMNLPFDAAREASLQMLGQTLLAIILPLTGITLTTAFVTAVIYNKGMLFAMKPVTPQLKRVSPGAGFKRIYGKRGMVETPISALRIYLWLGFALLVGVWPFMAILRQSACIGPCMANRIVPIVWLLVIGAVVVMIVTAVGEMLMQRKLFLHEQKMTETELKRERKDQHGSPEIRQERRRRMREANTQKRKTGAARATMCFYWGDKAVGIEFRPPKVALPYVVVKTDTAAETAKLRKLVTDKGWPEMQHEALTRAGLVRRDGETLDEQSYAAFIDAVTLMFGD